MKSILQGPKEEKKEKVKFPCLMIRQESGTVILFTGEGTGTVIHDPQQRWGVGFFSDNWAMTGHVAPGMGKVNLEPLKGKIILQN